MASSLEQREILVKTFRTRAQDLKALASAILLFIVAMLGFGVWIFFNASEIAKEDIGKNDFTRNIDESLKKISEIREDLAIFDNPYSFKLVYNNIMGSIDDDLKNFIDDNNLAIAISRRGCSEESSVLYEKLFYITDLYNKVVDDAIEQIGIGAIEYTEITTIFSNFRQSEIEGSAYVCIFPGSRFNPEYILILKNKFDNGNYANILSNIRESNEKVKTFEIFARKSFSSDGNIGKLIVEFAKNHNIHKALVNKELFLITGIEPNKETGREINNPWLVLQTNITRFGPLLLIFFFVSLMMNLYRYNIRLSSFYDARADAIELIEHDINENRYKELVNTLSTEGYDFGKNPKAPLDLAVDLAKSVVNKAK